MNTGGTERGYPGEAYDRAWRELVFPRDYRNPEPRRRYHLVVIGAGPAGLVVSIAAAGLGARVALVERRAMGGDCLNVGCVPSKALLEFTRRHPDRGADDAFAWLRRVRSEIAHHDSVERYRQHGVDVFLGAATFPDRDSVAVDRHRLQARRFVIATGARAALPPIPGLASCSPLTNETIFDLVEVPRRLAILGAGPIGCELAQAMARLGVEVHLFEMARRVLPGESAAAGEVLARALQSEGIAL
ncbi:MAG: FAD-dependent oxidoreductase, partial [Rhodospirillaceae bacterium]|nr:FAD-dependent oxidoreductase [Rhodospirillaceae bacterium]